MGHSRCQYARSEASKTCLLLASTASGRGGEGLVLDLSIMHQDQELRDTVTGFLIWFVLGLLEFTVDEEFLVAPLNVTLRELLAQATTVFDLIRSPAVTYR